MITSDLRKGRQMRVSQEKKKKDKEKEKEEEEEEEEEVIERRKNWRMLSFQL